MLLQRLNGFKLFIDCHDLKLVVSNKVPQYQTFS